MPLPCPYSSTHPTQPVAFPAHQLLGDGKTLPNLLLICKTSSNDKDKGQSHILMCLAQLVGIVTQLQED